MITANSAIKKAKPSLPPQPGSASSSRSQKESVFRHWTRMHAQAAKQSVERLAHQPLASLMTLLVIGIALTLPAVLFLILNNLESAATHWESNNRITLYLQADTTTASRTALIQQLAHREDIKQVHYISPEEGLRQFEKNTGLENVLSLLNVNPLPGVIEIEPNLQKTTATDLQKLLPALQELPAVDQAQMDLDWIQRFYAILSVVQHAAEGLGALLAAGVILIIGNTIRLIIQRHAHEIRVYQLLGATASMIRRPFLYTGFLYGALGGIVALALIDGFTAWLLPSTQQLTHLYAAQSFHIQHLNNAATSIVVCSGLFLGLFGAWLAVLRLDH